MLLAGALVAGTAAIGVGPTALAGPPPPPPSLCPGATSPLFGPNTCVFSPTMPQTTIQNDLDAISDLQVPNQFGSQRYAIFFEPGSYGSATDPLVFQVGYYTEVVGLGAMPQDTVINGAIDVFNQCSGGACEGSNNFWRSLSNLTINVDLPSSPTIGFTSPANGENTGCQDSAEMWAVSQAAPIRRTIINGSLLLQDYCGQGFVSGGFLADDEISGAIDFYGQQQYLTRNSDIGSSSNSVWNMVFSGVNGAPAPVFTGNGNQYTVVAKSPVTEEEPFLYTNSEGNNYRVFVPAVQHNSVGPSWASGTEAGTSIPIHQFFIASPSTPVFAINAALAFGQNLILTPGVYDLNQPIVVSRPNTVVMGLGFATLVPQRGNAAMVVTSDRGVELSGMIIDAGRVNSPVLLDVGCDGRPSFGQGSQDPNDWGFGCSSSQGYGSWGHDGSANDPDLIQDVFFRIGGAETTPTSATVSLLDNADSSIIDDVWAWRADHGNAVGWTVNQAATGVSVTGDNVTAYGLAVEHYQKYEVIWSGQNGTDIFFQNEMPYDPPSQAAWMEAPGVDGYAAFKVTDNVRSFTGYGMGSYSYFDIPVFAANGFEVPTTLPTNSLHDLFTVFLSTAGYGGISNVIDGIGGSSTIANPDVPVDVVSFP
jgi:hypothetical protein